MTDVHVLVLTGFGLNCDYETAFAFELAGAHAKRVHINSLVDGTVNLDDCQIMVFVGGFSWGDDHGAGVIQAIRMKTRMGEQLLDFAAKGNLILGICNGFQVLVNIGLLPGFNGDYKSREVALAVNDCGNFRNEWITLKVNPASPCVFTRGFDRLELPVRHGEGKFYAAESIISRLFEQEQVVVQYAKPDGRAANQAFPFNPNGSVLDIAGICDPTGRIFGLMPHPEAYHHPTNHPDWTRIKEQMKRQGRNIDTDPTPGIRLLQNGVDFIRQNR